MKTIKDKTERPHEHHVETPTPPQIMDPSELPENQSSIDDNKKKDSDKSKKQSKQNKSGGKGEPLTPNEEL